MTPKPFSYFVAALAVLGYVAFVVVLVSRVDSASEQAWLRTIYAFAGVETLAFAAAGFLFGREVNRSRTEAAEARASTAVSNGQAIAAQLRGLTNQYASREGGPSELARLAGQAEALFPTVAVMPRHGVGD